jgi:predicted phosphodiesterase
MIVAIISDVHSNLPALEAVITDARRNAATRVVCLGDLVGHNALPRETLAMLQSENIPSVVGNHDLMAIGRLEPDDCEPGARAAILWTRTVLSSDDISYLARLPSMLLLEPDVLCVHSALDDPAVRLTTAEQFREELAKIRRLGTHLRVCFTGHTHARGLAEIAESGRIITHKASRQRLRRASFYFVNPGSVGAPRGLDQRAAYALYDSEAGIVRLRRVPYDRTRIRRENTLRGLENVPEPSLTAYAMRKALHTLRRAGATLKAAR